MSGSLASLAGWYFLPGLVTGWVQAILYAVFIRVGDAKPAPGTPRFNRDRARIRIGVILLYLVYTIYEADYQLREAGDFYSNLGVTSNINEKGLQSRFRRLTIQFHPDKVTAADRPRVEAIFVRLKLARDTLIEPAKRFAYDRFGPDILQWQTCKTIRDYAMHGIWNTLLYYAGTAFALIGASVLGYLQSGKFWRYLVLITMFAIEVSIMTRPTFPTFLTSFINPILITTGIRSPLLPFQLLTLLRKLALTMFIAISQLEPLLKDSANEAPTSDQVTPQQYHKLSQLANATDQELQRLSAFEITQYGIGPEADASLRSSMKEWLVQNTIRNDIEVRTAMARAFEQRRALAES